MSQSYVRKTRIHHTYHRCIAIHGVHYLRFVDNVCFENMGHAVFMEDAVEVKNVVKGNLVIGTRPCYSCLVSDLTPSSYWIVNGDNYVREPNSNPRPLLCWSVDRHEDKCSTLLRGAHSSPVLAD